MRIIILHIFVVLITHIVHSKDLRNALKTSESTPYGMGYKPLVVRANLFNKMEQKLTLIKNHVEKRGKHWLGEYLCSCGNKLIAYETNVNRGTTSSCGCYKKTLNRERATKIGRFRTHGLIKENVILYRRWRGMNQRCNDSNSNAYKYYGGRGIKVCDEWSHYPNFYNWALNNGYKPELTIDRIDCDKGYCPENCRWITNLEQQRNKRGSISEEVFLKIKELVFLGYSNKEISNITNVQSYKIASYKLRYNWPRKSQNKQP